MLHLLKVQLHNYNAQFYRDNESSLLSANAIYWLPDKRLVVLDISNDRSQTRYLWILGPLLELLHQREFYVVF